MSENPYAGNQAKPVMASKAAKPKTSVMAVFSMVFGFLSIFLSCFAGLIGLILGIISLIKINGSNGKLGGTPFAIIGIVASIFWSMFSLILIGMLLPAVQQVREVARRTTSINNIRQINLAQLNYMDANARFPGEQIGSDAPGSGLSWRVHILPYLEEQALYDQFNLDEPWDSPHNKTLIDQMPEIYVSLGGQGGDLLGPGETLYLRPIGNGAWTDPNDPNFLPVDIGKIADGFAGTAAVVEVDVTHAAIWTKPDDDYYFDPNDPKQGLGQQRFSVTIVGFADGSVHSMPDDVPPEDYRAMFTLRGAEGFTPPAYR